MVFAFSIALYGQHFHAQTFPRFAIPLCFYFCYLFTLNFRLRYFFISIFFLVYQFYCALYLGFLLAIPVGLFYLILIIVNFNKIRTYYNTKYLLQGLFCLLFNVVLLLPLILPYLNSPILVKEGGGHSFHKFSDIAHSLPTVQSYLFFSGKSLFWNFLNANYEGLKYAYNHQLFPGLMVVSSILFLFAVLIKKQINRSIKLNGSRLVLLITAIATFLIFLKVGSFTLYNLIYYVPGFGSMRALQRIINVEVLFFGASVGLFYLYLAKSKINSTVLFLIFIAWFCADNFVYSKSYVQTEKKYSEERLHSLSTRLNTFSKDEVFVYQPEYLVDNSIDYQLDAMLAAQENGLKTINGYSSTSPAHYGSFWKTMSDKDLNYWLEKRNTSFTVKSLGGGTEMEIQKIINGIKSDSMWFSTMLEKARNQNRDIDEVLVRNAKWLLEMEEKKKAGKRSKK